MVRQVKRCAVLFTLLLLFTLLVIDQSHAVPFGKKSKTTTTTTFAPAFGEGGVVQAVPSTILTSPDRGCPTGQRKDSKGRCRTSIH